MARAPTTSNRPPKSALATGPRSRVVLRRDATCGDALAAGIRAAQNDVTAARLVVLETDDPAGPHQVRVAIRRLRAAVRAFRPLADMTTMRKLDAHAKAIATAVAPLREADVLVHETCRLTGIDRDPGHAALLVALHAHRAVQLHAARAVLSGKPWASLQLYLSLAAPAAADHPSLRRPLTGFAAKAIERRWRRVAVAGQGLAHQTVEQRHAFRLHLKKLRYTIDVFKPLYAARRKTAEQVKLFQAELKAVQDIFGYLNDVAQAAHLSRIVAEGRSGEGQSGEGATQRLVGYIQGWHAARAEQEWKAAQKRWKRLRKAPRFWR